MITGRDDEFRATITYFYKQELGREPDPGGMASFLRFAQNGGTGAQIQQIIHDSPEGIAYRARPQVAHLQRVTVDGERFISGGKEWRMLFADSFRAYERFLNQGADSIRPVFSELRDLGANGVRVLGAFDFGTPAQQRLYPAEHANYYDSLGAFHNVAAEFGLYTQFCVFADTQRSVPGVTNQLLHWNRVCDSLRGIPNLLLERVNEANQHENAVEADLPRPAGIISSFGSNGTGDDPPLPFWDYCDLGSERRGDFALSTTTVWFSIKGYGTDFPGTHRATVVSEPPGFSDTPSGSRTNDPRIAYLLGLGTHWGAGGCAHSDCGVQSVLLTPIQRECVKEFLRGAK